MIIVCAWCNKKLGEKEGEGVSHGICPECASALKDERYDCPVHGEQIGSDCPRC